MKEADQSNHAFFRHFFSLSSPQKDSRLTTTEEQPKPPPLTLPRDRPFYTHLGDRQPRTCRMGTVIRRLGTVIRVRLLLLLPFACTASVPHATVVCCTYDDPLLCAKTYPVRGVDLSGAIVLEKANLSKTSTTLFLIQ